MPLAWTVAWQLPCRHLLAKPRYCTSQQFPYHSLHFWDWEKRNVVQEVNLGAEGLVPFEVRRGGGRVAGKEVDLGAVASSQWG